MVRRVSTKCIRFTERFRMQKPSLCTHREAILPELAYPCHTVNSWLLWLVKLDLKHACLLSWYQVISCTVMTGTYSRYLIMQLWHHTITQDNGAYIFDVSFSNGSILKSENWEWVAWDNCPQCYVGFCRMKSGPQVTTSFGPGKSQNQPELPVTADWYRRSQNPHVIS